MSRSLWFPALLALLATPLTASADHLTELIFTLGVEQTNPPASIPMGAPTPSGMATIVVDSNAMTISWDVDYQDLTGPIVAPGAHFHGPAPLGSNANVQIFLSNGNPPEPATGNLSGMSSITAQQMSDVLAGLWYLNIHTEANPSGELRGQVTPEPASLGLLAAIGLAGVGATRRRAA